MANLNKVMLIGNLTKDAELRYIPSGQPVLEFRLAVSRRYRTQAGEDREESLFIDVSLWGRRGEAVSRFLTRGTPLFVEGRLKMDEWERDGQRRSKMTVVAQNIEFLGRRNGEAGGGRGQQQESGYARNQGGSGYQNAGGQQGGSSYQNAGGQQGGSGYQNAGGQQGGSSYQNAGGQQGGSSYQNAGGQQGGSSYQNAGGQQGGSGYQNAGGQQGGSSYQASGGGYQGGGGSSYGGGHDGQSSYQGPPTNGPPRGQTAGAQAAGAPEVAPPVPAPVVEPQPVTAAAPPPGLDIADDEVPF